MRVASFYFLLSGLLLITPGCLKKGQIEDVNTDRSPKLTTKAIDEVRSYTAYTTMYLINNDNGSIFREGFLLSTSPDPTLANSVTPVIDTVVSSAPTGLVISDLTPNTTYYLRAYAETSYGIGYGNVVSFTTKPTALVIGGDYEGGTVFYIDGSGQHGLVAAPFDIDNSVRWTNETNTTGFTTGTGINTGYANTDAIINMFGTASDDYAALKCRNRTINGYSDWFLPSKDELDSMWVKLYLPHIITFETASSISYWTSSTHIPAYSVYFEHFSTGNKGYKDIMEYSAIRSCRAF